MVDPVLPSCEALQEALLIAGELLGDVELSRITLSAAALKVSRLARLMNDIDAQRMFRYEASGYPTKPNGVPPEPWRLAQLAGRTYEWQDPQSQEVKTVAFLESIEELEKQIEGAKLGLQATADRSISVSSANPNQYLFTPSGNIVERRGYLDQLTSATKRLSSRRVLIYRYASRRYYELRYSEVAQDVFAAVRQEVDKGIADVVPDAVRKLVSIHDNLRSENPEDLSNAVHSCRRILKDLADALFPPQKAPRRLPNGKEVDLRADNYINRLVCFAEDHST